MKILKILLFIIFFLNSFQGKPQGGPTPPNNCATGNNTGFFAGIKRILNSISILIFRPKDPNEIIGPSGYDTTKKWVCVNATLGYKILFENDPDFATAPAKKVVVYLPIDAKINPNSIRIGDFGFGSFVFTVPAGKTSYTNRLDVRDSLGVFVDVTAGLDIASRRAFWIFESIDPATGLAGTVAPDKGFLPINDSTRGNGEGFVTLTLQPVFNAKTRDTATEKATIYFDTEDAIPTDTWLNTIDAVAPVSKVTSLPSLVDSVFNLSWSGKDDSLGAGVKSYSLYVSEDNSPFFPYKTNTDSITTVFTGKSGSTYSFYTIATDNTGNKEAPKTVPDQTVTIKGNGILVSVKAFLAGAYNISSGLMIDSLRTKILLPAADPYRSLGYSPVNNPTPENIKAGVYDSTNNKAVTDWVWLELRNSANPVQILSTRAALIRRDGRVVDMDGSSPVFFNSITEGTYYVAIRHRNHLGAMTANALTLKRNVNTLVDFTDPATLTFGTDAQSIVNGIAMLWAGDTNGDKEIRYNGGNNDKNLILGKVGLGSPNEIIPGYDKSDANLDGVTRYTGSNNDKNTILKSVGLDAPSRVIKEQIPK